MILNGFLLKLILIFCERILPAFFTIGLDEFAVPVAIGRPEDINDRERPEYILQ